MKTYSKSFPAKSITDSEHPTWMHLRARPLKKMQLMPFVKQRQELIKKTGNYLSGNLTHSFGRKVFGFAAADDLIEKNNPGFLLKRNPGLPSLGADSRT